MTAQYLLLASARSLGGVFLLLAAWVKSGFSFFFFFYLSLTFYLFIYFLGGIHAHTVLTHSRSASYINIPDSFWFPPEILKLPVARLPWCDFSKLSLTVCEQIFFGFQTFTVFVKNRSKRKQFGNRPKLTEGFANKTWDIKTSFCRSSTGWTERKRCDYVLLTLFRADTVVIFAIIEVISCVIIKVFYIPRICTISTVQWCHYIRCTVKFNNNCRKKTQNSPMEV